MKLNARKQNFDLIWLRKELCRILPNGNLVVSSIGLLSPVLQADVMLILLFRHRFGFLPTISNPDVAKILDILIDDFNL